MVDGVPAAGEVQIDLAKLSSDDIGTAGEALAGLFAEPEEQTQEIPQEGREAAQPADAEAAETPPIGEDETGQSEPGKSPAIEPPVSWTAEEKQLFATLPPETQSAIARRESEREKLTLTQSREVSERVKAVEAEREQLANIRAQQTNALSGLLIQLYPELDRFQKVDWDTLARERPAEWAQQRQAFDGLMMRINLAQQQLGQIRQNETTEQQKRGQEFLKQQRDLLVEKVPDFADTAKFKAFGDDVLRYVPEITKEELGSISDHRYLLVLKDALAYRKGTALRKEAQTKITPAKPTAQRLAPAPRRSGSAGEEAQARVLSGLHDNLRKSGRTDDAAALLVASGIFGKA